MKIYVVGSGKLANALLSADLELGSSRVVKWQPEFAEGQDAAIIIHAGSGRELKTCIGFCARTGSVLIELSTGLETETLQPDFPLIVCPNTSILVLRVLVMLKSMGKYFSGSDISIVESHQSTKQSAPGTAYKFAEYLNVPLEKIRSVRDPEIQSGELGIPKDFLDKHAFHRITIREGNDVVTIETSVQGHESYSSGVKKIVDTVLKNPLQKRRYTVLDLIENGWL